MMTIDGKDIRNEYGCVLLAGSLNDLFKYPKRAEVYYNNWAEADGIEPDLTEINLDSRLIKLTFLMTAATHNALLDSYSRLFSDLTADGYRTMNIVPGMTHSLRLNTNSMYSCPIQFTAGANVATFTLEFVEDIMDMTPTGASSSLNVPGGIFEVNGIDFKTFGVCTDADPGNTFMYPAMKDPFTDGRTIYLDSLKTQHKTLNLSLYMIAGSISEFITNWKAFFTQFNQTGLLDLYFRSVGATTQAYYSDCSSFTIEQWNESRIAARFTLQLVIPRMTWVSSGGSTLYRVILDSGTGLVLATETGKLIVI